MSRRAQLTAVCAALALAACPAAGPARDAPAVDVPPPDFVALDTPEPYATVEPLPPQLLYVELPPAPPQHRVTARLLPEGAASLRLVERVEVTVEVSGGPVGNRDVGVVFVAPAGIAWQQEVRRVDAVRGVPLTVRFSLPVAATLIEDHSLAGRWTLTTLDDGAELAAADFVLPE